MSLLNKVFLAGAALIFLPVLLSPAGWIFATIILVGWAIFVYGGRELIEIQKSRYQGERSAKVRAELAERRRDLGDDLDRRRRR